jgi:hypothetical protein
MIHSSVELSNRRANSSDQSYGVDIVGVDPIREIEETSKLRQYFIGEMVGIIRPDDDEKADFGTVKFVEKDDEIDMYWLYIVANDMNLNQQTDPKLKSPFWRIIENTNPNLFKAEPRDL